MKNSFVLILFLLVFNSCFGLTNKFISNGFDDTRNEMNKDKLSNCDIDTIRNYDKYFYRNKYGNWAGALDIITGLYGIYFYYPNGLKMFGAYSYLIIGATLMTPENSLEEEERKQDRTNKSSLSHKWNKAHPSDCKNNSDYFYYKNTYEVELDMTRKENLQLRENDSSLSKQYMNKCLENSDIMDEDFYNKLINTLYSKVGFYKSGDKVYITKNDKIDYFSLPDREPSEEEIKEIQIKEKINFNTYKNKFEILKKNKKLQNIKFITKANLHNSNKLDCQVEAYFHYIGGNNQLISDVEKIK